jgi:hypothetical protein
VKSHGQAQQLFGLDPDRRTGRRRTAPMKKCSLARVASCDSELPRTQRPLTFCFLFTKKRRPARQRPGVGQCEERRALRCVSLPAAGLSLLGSLCGRGGALIGSPPPGASDVSSQSLRAFPQFLLPGPSHACSTRQSARLCAECCAASVFSAALPRRSFPFVPLLLSARASAFPPSSSWGGWLGLR